MWIFYCHVYTNFFIFKFRLIFSNLLDWCQCVASNQKCPGDSHGCKLIDRVLPNMHRNGNSQKMDLLQISFFFKFPTRSDNQNFVNFVKRGNVYFYFLMLFFCRMWDHYSRNQMDSQFTFENKNTWTTNGRTSQFLKLGYALFFQMIYINKYDQTYLPNLKYNHPKSISAKVWIWRMWFFWRICRSTIWW